MTAKELAAACGWTLLAGGEGEDNQIDGCYIGDLLSWVMARAQSGNVWITVMGNVNAVAVAVLRELSCIILCEEAHLDEDARARAEENDVPILASKQDAYSLALALGRLLCPS